MVKSWSEYLWKSDICLWAFEYLAKLLFYKDIELNTSAKTISQEHLAFTQKGRTQDNASFQYLFVDVTAKEKKDGGAVLLLGFVRLQGLGGGWGLPRRSSELGQRD